MSRARDLRKQEKHPYGRGERQKERPRGIARRLARRRDRTAVWNGRMETARKRVTGPAPTPSKNYQKRAMLEIAQSFNPAIRSRKGAKKLERRMERAR